MTQFKLQVLQIILFVIFFILYNANSYCLVHRLGYLLLLQYIKNVTIKLEDKKYFILKHKVTYNISSKINVELSPSKKNCFIYFNKSRLKMMKNAFYLTLKALFLLRVFKFLS